MKICSGCCESKQLNEFYKRQSKCKVCCKSISRKYRQNNKDKIRKMNNTYRKNNPEKVKKWSLVSRQREDYKWKEYRKKWRLLNKYRLRELARKAYWENPEKYREKTKRNKNPELRKIYEKRIYHHNINNRLSRICRVRIKQALKGEIKVAKTEILVGCSFEYLKKHLESKFKEGMTWDNYGTWHVDHIIPCASFDLSDKEQQLKCFHYSNLQPLWAEENLRKGCKI